MHICVQAIRAVCPCLLIPYVFDLEVYRNSVDKAPGLAVDRFPWRHCAGAQTVLGFGAFCISKLGLFNLFGENSMERI